MSTSTAFQPRIAHGERLRLTNKSRTRFADFGVFDQSHAPTRASMTKCGALIAGNILFDPDKMSLERFAWGVVKTEDDLWSIQVHPLFEAKATPAKDELCADIVAYYLNSIRWPEECDPWEQKTPWQIAEEG